MQCQAVPARALQIVEQPAAERGLDADAQHLTRLLQGDVGDLPQLQDLAGAFEQLLTRDGQRDAALVAVEQDHVELAFQLTNLTRQGGLSDVQPLGGVGEVQFLSDGDEIPQVAQMRVHSPLLSESVLNFQPIEAGKSGYGSRNSRQVC